MKRSLSDINDFSLYMVNQHQELRLGSLSTTKNDTQSNGNASSNSMMVVLTMIAWERWQGQLKYHVYPSVLNLHCNLVVKDLLLCPLCQGRKIQTSEINSVPKREAATK